MGRRIFLFVFIIADYFRTGLCVDVVHVCPRYCELPDLN